MAALHAIATPVAGGGQGSHLSKEGDPPHSIDPALLASLDLESDDPHIEMLVSDAQHHHYTHGHQHDLNHNDHMFVQKSQGVLFFLLVFLLTLSVENGFMLVREICTNSVALMHCTLMITQHNTIHLAWI